MLSHLMEPIGAISRIVRRFALDGVLPSLPADGGDGAGELLAEARHTIKHMNRRLRQLAEFDQITGLPNRKTFKRDLTTRMGQPSHFALCAMSFSNYDLIASGFGQEAIDTTCRQVAHRLIEILEPNSLIARVDAKTFLFEIELADECEFFATRVEQIRLNMQKELCLPDFNIYPEMDAGVSCFTGQQTDAETLMNEAMSAMTENDSEAVGKTHLFSPAHSLAARNASLIERDLRLAVELEQLALHFQPIVNLDTGRVVGAEALVRWTHPERGSVSPGVFIPIAEKSGLIDELGLWILQETCRQLEIWSSTGLRTIKLSMNLSARQFLRPHTVQLILEAIDAHSIDGSRLEVELTETTMIEDRARTLELLEEFRAAGINTAIDDFGAGFTSLSYLKTLPFDRIKIDREFIRDVHQSSKGSAICKSLIELGKGLGMEVLAEGTETAEEVDKLRALGCSLFQGYYFARPVPAEQFPDAIARAEGRIYLHRPPSPGNLPERKALPHVH